MAEPLEKIIGGKYQILHKIKDGGMGSIYRVRHRLLEETRVVKVLKAQFAEDVEFRTRFQNEARAAIALKHPNIAHLYDFSMDESGFLYIVMEFIDGVTLEQLVAETGPPPTGLAVAISRQCLSALGYLHRQGFVHRDVAADNFMLTTDFDEKPLVKLIDLGIAKDTAVDTNLTATGLFMGKVRYSPPEQFAADRGASQLDERSDIYSFGVLLYELLTGQTPFAGETFQQLVAGHLFQDPKPFDETDPEGKVPDELRSAVREALEKDPDRRIQSAEELSQRLAPFEAGEGGEVVELIAATASAIGEAEQPAQPGTTQSRLDRQFNLREESAARAGQDGDAAPATVAGAGLASTVRGGGSPAKGARRPGLAALAASPAGLAAAGAALLLVAVLIAWLVFSRGAGEPAATVGDGTGTETPVEAAAPDPLDPGAGGPEAAGAGPEADAERGDRPAPRPGELVFVRQVRPYALVAEAEAAELAAVRLEPPPATEAEAAATGLRDDAPPAPTEPAEPAEAEGADDVVAQAGSPVDEPAGGAAEDEPELRLPEGPAALLRAEPGVIPPVLLEMPEPVYPSEVKEPLLIELEVLVDEHGKVATSTIKKAPMFKRKFRQAAQEAAEQARYRPASQDGVAGKMYVRLVIRFEPK